MAGLPADPRKNLPQERGRGLPLEPNWPRSRCVALGFTSEVLQTLDLAMLVDSLAGKLPEGLRLVAWDREQFDRQAWLLLAHPAFKPAPEGQRVPTISLRLRREKIDGELRFDGVHPDWPWDPDRKFAWDNYCTLEQVLAVKELSSVDP